MCLKIAGMALQDYNKAAYCETGGEPDLKWLARVMNGYVYKFKTNNISTRRA